MATTESTACQQRAALVLAVTDARALLAAAHVIEGTIVALAHTTATNRVHSAVAAVRNESPALMARLINLLATMERLAARSESTD